MSGPGSSQGGRAAAARLAAAGLLLALLAGCAGLPLGPQIPGRRGLMLALEQFEAAARWRNWPVLLDFYYLPEHAREVARRFAGDPERWFRAWPSGAALAGGAVGEERHLCVLALRGKRVSPRFDPHYVVYYRVQDEPCGELPDGDAPRALAEGQMEWGYEPKERRWVHLRPLG